MVGVHDRDDSRRQEALGRDAIEVTVIDDRDLAPTDALGEILGAQPESHLVIKENSRVRGDCLKGIRVLAR